MQELSTDITDINETYLLKLCEKIEHDNKTLHAFLPEENRYERIRSEVEKNLSKASDPLPLLGISIGIKDIFRMDGLPTRAGSKLPADALSGNQASIVTKLKSAGAIIMGKTVTTEFAYAEPNETVHPIDHRYSPGGSSGGSAAAVAAGLCAIAIGSQTIGSTIRPAAYCGIIGFKSSHGRIATDGMIPFAPSLDSVGLFSKTAQDLESIAGILYNNWKRTTELPQQISFGVPTGPYLKQSEAEVRDIFTRFLPNLINAGYTIRTVPALDDIEQTNICIWNIAAYEMAQVHKDWYKKYQKLYRPKTAALIEKGIQISEVAYQHMLQEKEAIKMNIHQTMDKEKIDFWLTPATTSFAPHTLTYTGDPSMNIPWTLSGMPAVTLPLKTNTMPLGLQIVGKLDEDEKLLRISKKLERIIHHE